jgi:hypothetical protein
LLPPSKRQTLALAPHFAAMPVQSMVEAMNDTQQENHSALYPKIIAKAWSDPAYKARLLADPRAALAEAGVSVPAGKAVRVVENTDRLVHLVLPQRPTGELSEADLDNAAGGIATHALIPAV